MKKILFILCAFASLQIRAQYHSIDLTNISVVGGVTIVGDSLPTAFSKINTNFGLVSGLTTNLQSQITTNCISISNLNALMTYLQTIVVTNGGTNWNLGGVFSGDGTRLTVNGTNLVSATVNSNSFDADTLALIGSGGGGGGWLPGGELAFDFDGSTTNITSDGSGNISAVSIKSGLKDSSASTGSYGHTAVSMGDGTWTWMAGVTITNNFTNTITAYAFSNMVLSSKSVTTYQTNMAFWNASNFLGRVNGLHKFTASGGDDGNNPPISVPVHFEASYNGSNGWFRITNNIFYTSNTVSVVLIRDGARPVNPGAAKLTTIDHWELKDRTNSTFGQYWEIDYPVSPQNPATKEYVDGLFLNTYDANWSSYTSNNIFHYVFKKYNKVMVDMTSVTAFIPIATNSFDGVNMLMVIQQTNLTTGYLIESLTDLSFQNSWQTWTNYTLSTNSGAVTFTVPINLSEEARFFRARGQATNTVAFADPVHFNGGTVYPSNTFNLADITNRLNALGSGKHYWTGSSNGLALVTISYSNGVVRWIRADY